jgi:hypothetical protein
LLGAHVPTARTEAWVTRFLPSVVLATSRVWVRFAAAHCLVIGLYGHATHRFFAGLASRAVARGTVRVGELALTLLALD